MPIRKRAKANATAPPEEALRSIVCAPSLCLVVRFAAFAASSLNFGFQLVVHGLGLVFQFAHLLVDEAFDLVTQLGTRLWREEHGKCRSENHTAQERGDTHGGVFHMHKIFSVFSLEGANRAPKSCIFVKIFSF